MEQNDRLYRFVDNLLTAYYNAVVADSYFEEEDLVEAGTIIDVIDLENTQHSLELVAQWIQEAKHQAPSSQLRSEADGLLNIAVMVKERVDDMSLNEKVNRNKQPIRVVTELTKYLTQKFNPEASIGPPPKPPGPPAPF